MLWGMEKRYRWVKVFLIEVPDGEEEKGEMGKHNLRCNKNTLPWAEDYCFKARYWKMAHCGMLFARRTTIFALPVSVSLCNVTLKFLPSRSPFESDLASWLTKDSQCSVALVMSDSLQPTRLLCPWNFPGKNTGVGCHALLQRIFPTQGLNPRLLHCRWILYHWATLEAQR